MKLIWAGDDGAGRTCVLNAGSFELSTDTIDGKLLFYAPQFPPTVPAKSAEGFVPPGSWGDAMPPDPGEVTWMVVRFPPGGEYERHQTPTLDFDSIVAGSIELTLDDGVHEVKAGDCVILAGIDHAWRAGPDGCTMTVVMLGAFNREEPR
jgi:quercetin dioxygenase-like cupin family protein